MGSPPGLAWVSFGVPRVFPKGFAGRIPPLGFPRVPWEGVSWPGFLLVSTQDLASTELRVGFDGASRRTTTRMGSASLLFTRYCLLFYIIIIVCTLSHKFPV